MKNALILAPALALFGLSACKNNGTDVNAPAFAERTSFTAARQYPEGIAYAPTLNKFVVTSLTLGKVGTVDVNGVYADLFSDAQLISTQGVKVYNGKVYVCNAAQGIATKTTAAATMKTAGLFVYNLSTNQIERRTDLAALLPNNQHLANDVAIDAQGVAYVTDSFSPVVYRVGSDGAASILVNNPVLGVPSGQFGLNGIVAHPNNYLIVVVASTGKLYKIDLANSNTITEVTGFSPVTGGDGMVLINDDLYVVNNRNQVTQLRGANNWATASVIKTDAAGYDQATTNTVVNGQVYTLNARIGEISAAAGNPTSLTSSAYSIQRFK
ncbi:gluconolaconase [Fibrella forsythiae]|uniref:Gluconolaconase n=1 Tax=Fibrella forsythiae TaxID=2817061 RepID=A0ABS3JJU2_9BACT|nr:gluconolaconase [Fibrella forsythiae]MBO0949696.1 gluconolaconase [Fibrella forsythiae]